MIRIMNHNFKITDTITKPVSVEFEKLFKDYGTFTVQIPESSATENIANEAIIKHKNNYGVIRYISQNESGIIIKGIELKGILSQRYVYTQRSGKAEAVMKAFVNEAITGTNRGFSNFSVAANQGRGKDITYYMEKPKMLDVVLKEICDEANLGYEVSVKNKQMIFDVVVPSELNYVYSRRRGNIGSYEYSFDALSEKNVAVNCIKNETSGKHVATAYGETGKSGIYRKEMLTEFSDSVSDECLRDLEENKAVEAITADLINPDDYGSVWNLGDYIKIKIEGYKESLTMKKQITGITECFEANKHTVVPVFGEEKESVITKIIRKRG